MNQTNRDDEPEKILAGVDSRSEPFHASDLNWRPEGKNSDIPQSVYVARLSMLGDGDRAALEREFSQGRSGREFKRLFFGGDVYGTKARNDAATMMHCAFAGGDEEGAMRIFCASASFDGVRMDDGAVTGFDENGKCVLRDERARFRPLAKEAAGIAAAYREKFDALRKEPTSRAKENGAKAMASERTL